MNKLRNIRRQWKCKIESIKRENKRYWLDLLGSRQNPANHWSNDRWYLEIEAMKKQMSDDILEEEWWTAQRNIYAVSELEAKTAKAADEAMQRGLEADYASGIVKRPDSPPVQVWDRPRPSVYPGAVSGLKTPACYYTIEFSALVWNEKRLNPDRPWVAKRFEQLTSAEKLIIWSLRNRHGIEISQFNEAELAVLDEVDTQHTVNVSKTRTSHENI